MQDNKNHFSVDDFSSDDFSEEETEFQRKVKRVAKISISLFLVFLMLSFVIPQDVVLSLVSSKEVQNYQIDLGSKQIIFTQDVYERLKQYYFTHQFSEFKLCLTGEINTDSKIDKSTYAITDFYSPEIFHATPISVHSVICNDKTIIDLHSHPFRNCLFSEQDVSSYNSFQNKQMLGVIMCDVDRFSFFS